jgi:hypothetical protein
MFVLLIVYWLTCTGSGGMRRPRVLSSPSVVLMLSLNCCVYTQHRHTYTNMWCSYMRSSALSMRHVITYTGYVWLALS